MINYNEKIYSLKAYMNIKIRDNSTQMKVKCPYFGIQLFFIKYFIIGKNYWQLENKSNYLMKIAFNMMSEKA